MQGSTVKLATLLMWIAAAATLVAGDVESIDADMVSCATGLDRETAESQPIIASAGTGFGSVVGAVGRPVQGMNIVGYKIELWRCTYPLKGLENVGGWIDSTVCAPAPFRTVTTDSLDLRLFRIDSVPPGLYRAKKEWREEIPGLAERRQEIDTDSASVEDQAKPGEPGITDLDDRTAWHHCSASIEAIRVVADSLSVVEPVECCSARGPQVAQEMRLWDPCETRKWGWGKVVLSPDDTNWVLVQNWIDWGNYRLEMLRTED